MSELHDKLLAFKLTELNDEIIRTRNVPDTPVNTNQLFIDKHKLCCMSDKQLESLPEWKAVQRGDFPWEVAVKED